jgi:acetylornithine deacetylase
VPFDSCSWQSDPFRLLSKDQRWYGLGVCDMKGFFPMALQTIEASKDFLQRPLTLLATADEESAMTGARLLQQRGETIGDYVLIGEPTGLRPIHQHKGIMMEEIVVEGRTGHSSQPALGRNALEAMTDVILELRKLRQRWYEQYHNPGFEVPTPTLNLGCIHGGDNPNRICRQCQLQFDVRLMPGMQIEAVRAAVTACLQPLAQQHDLSISLHTLFDGVNSFEQDSSSRLVKLCESLTGKASGSVAFATEAPFFKALGAETLVMGPGDIEQAHQPDEYLSMDRVEPMLTVLGELVRHLCID